MKKKQQKIQLVLISMGLLLILLTYFYYPHYINKSQEDQFIQKDLVKSTDSTKATTFKEVQYEGRTATMQEFSVKSESAYILDESPDLIFMKSMKVELYLNDGRIVTIISDQGRYQKQSHDCWFEKNVIVDDGETKIFADNLDLLLATEKFAKAYNNVKLNHSTGSLKADIILYDFETKYFKVAMFGDKVVKMKVIK